MRSAMRKRGGGRIVNQVSGGAFPAVSIYGISKLALVGLTTTLARQLGRESIAVNAIAPGNTTSDAGKLLTPDDFEGLDHLAEQILAFEQHYNAQAKPFDWRFTRTDLNQLLARIHKHDRFSPPPMAA